MLRARTTLFRARHGRQLRGEESGCVLAPGRRVVGLVPSRGRMPRRLAGSYVARVLSRGDRVVTPRDNISGPRRRRDASETQRAAAEARPISDRCPHSRPAKDRQQGRAAVGSRTRSGAIRQNVRRIQRGRKKEKDDGAARSSFSDSVWSRPMDGALGLGFEGEGFPTLPYRSRGRRGDRITAAPHGQSP